MTIPGGLTAMMMGGVSGGGTFFDEVIADSPVVYWTMDGSGTADEIGSNDLNFANGVLIGQPPILASGDSITTDGLDDTVIATSVLSSLSLPITFETLVNLPVTATDQIIGGTNATAANYTGALFFADTVNGMVGILLGDGAGTGSSNRKSFNTASGLISASTDYHIVIRINSLSSVEVIINDVVHNAPFTSGTGASISFASGLATLGYRVPASVTRSNMIFDDTAIYNSGLSNARISAHFAATGL